MTDLPTRRTVTCPTCKGPSLYAAENAYRPFCSERCKNMDFGAWASESFRVAAVPSADSETERPAGPSVDGQAPH